MNSQPAADLPPVPTDRPAMVNWFSPPQLTRTGLLALLSDVFGTYADRREMQAALNPKGEIIRDWENETEVRLDFISDLGEGWDSTYSLAYLLAQPQVQVRATADAAAPKRTLPKADIVLMGGDLVYPTPTVEEYKRRFVAPYETAFPPRHRQPGQPPAAGRPQLFAIPGNHDWYDGLGAFLKLMCQQRTIGSWQTRQQRSYFAIKLPHNWWVWGIDIQLHADIDAPQKAYFRKACQMAQEGDKVILLTAEPVWVHPGHKTDLTPLHTLQFFCEEFITKPKPGSRQPTLQLPLILSGDLHHYAAYQGHDPVTHQPEWRITAGGGGAFLHPTHQLKEHLQMPGGGPAYRGTFYPAQATSRRLTWQNLLFPFRNLPFVLLLGCVYLLFAWAVAGTEIHYKDPTKNIVGTLPDLVQTLAISKFDTLFWRVLLTRPWLMLIPVVLMVALYQFTDIKTTQKFWARIISAGHSLTQLVALFAVPTVFVLVVDELTSTSIAWGEGWVVSVGGLLVVAAIGALVGGLLMGVYLLVSLLLIHTHENEAFSALRIPDYKNFLRMHLTPEGLEIHAIGLDKVSRKWKISADAQAVSRLEPETPLDPHLIETHFIPAPVTAAVRQHEDAVPH
ncbi:hypothetical protein GCM10027048_11090 [Hymenobacter coalescens]